MEQGRTGGSYRNRLMNTDSINIRDFENPWNFFSLMMAGDEVIFPWLRSQGLLAETLPCNSKDCGGSMTLKKFARAQGGIIFRCDINRNHQQAARTNSFFEKSNLTIPDIMLFLKNYLDRLTLRQCSQFSGMAYGSTAVNWGSMTRELFKEYFETQVKWRQLNGVIEIDESLFGRRVKHNRGNPNAGLKIWIFGLVERETNRIILYPVQDRSEETLIPIIQRHVAPGGTIYSDGWSAYCNLNEMGFEHFTVIHKYSFKKIYTNVTTGEKVEVHTNRIEGAWKHAKDHFKKMQGTKLGQFESHLAEVMWRADVKGDLYEKFFELVKTVYPLDRPATYTYTTPLFDSWNMQRDDGQVVEPSDWTIQPGNTDAESESEVELTSTSTSSSSKSSRPTPRSSVDSFHRAFPPQRTVRRRKTGKTNTTRVNELSLLSELFSATSIDSSDDEADKTITETGGANQPGPSTAPVQESTSQVSSRQTSGTGRSTGQSAAPAPSGTSSTCSRGKGKGKKERVCHPPGFLEASSTDSDFDNPRVLRKRHKKSATSQLQASQKRGQSQSSSGPYSKSAFVWNDNDDDDFE